MASLQRKHFKIKKILQKIPEKFRFSLAVSTVIHAEAYATEHCSFSFYLSFLVRVEFSMDIICTSFIKINNFCKKPGRNLGVMRLQYNKNIRLYPEPVASLLFLCMTLFAILTAICGCNRKPSLEVLQLLPFPSSKP